MAEHEAVPRYDVIVSSELELQGIHQESLDWAAAYLIQTLQSKGLAVYDGRSKAGGADVKLQIVLTGVNSAAVQRLSQQAGLAISETAEAFGILPEAADGKVVVTAAGNDTRGLLYAILELADIAKHAADPVGALGAVRPAAEKPYNPVRSITRLFSSEVEDKAWFYDRSFWDDYLTELATQRFNQFTFGVGCGYDYLIDKIVLDTYFCFIYPYLLAVPGYHVQVSGLDAEEQQNNLLMLQYISKQAKLRGLKFCLGLWNHAYDYGPDNTNQTYAIQGLDASNHASYSRDALKLLLQTCPDIDGLFFRVHFEGGIPEPTHHFWRVVMDGLKEIDRTIDIAYHAKGVDSELVDIAAGAGMPVVISPKYWGEHLGPPYHQASIRNREFYPRVNGRPADVDAKEGGGGAGMEVTSKRSFTRYGYADFFKDNRNYEVVHRVWPGTQRLLTWGDPASAAGYGRSGTFEGSHGFEWFEPLSFKGRKGSGSPNGRELYADESLQLAARDWTKFSYTYRLLGRLAYNPEADRDSWQRFLRHEFQGAAEACEAAMSQASRILPFIMLVHAPSVANNVYWPEMYTNMPLVRVEPAPGTPARTIYGHPVNYDFDTEKPHTFGSCSPLDPVLIYRVNEFADDVLQGRRSGKYSPLEVAAILENLADSALQQLTAAEAAAVDGQQPSFRRWAIDVRIMAGIGRFFADKFRAALAYALFERTNDAQLLQESLDYYYSARAAWEQIVAASAGAYKEDLTFGLADYSRGHWSDRIGAIAADIAEMERIYRSLPADSPRKLTVSTVLASFQNGNRPVLRHIPEASFGKGEPVLIQATLERSSPQLKVWLHYRHVNQAEAYAVTEMAVSGDVYAAVIPAEYTGSAYSLQYLFEVGYAGGDKWLVPGFEETLSNQPYYVLSGRESRRTSKK